MYFLRFVLFCTDTVNDFLSKNCQYIAGAIAFYALFSMFPLLLATVSIWAFFLGPSAEKGEMAQQMADVFPVSSDFVGSTVNGVISARTITSAASVLALLWAASAAFGAIRKGINAAWGVTNPRPFLRERLIDLGLVAGAGILMLLLLFITPLIGSLEELVHLVFPEVEYRFIAQLTSRVVSPLLSFITFLILYRYMPNTKVSFREIWPCALLAAIAFETAKSGFLWYIKTYPIYNIVYGAVGAVMAFLTWVYVSALVMLFGALLSSRYSKFVRHADGEMQRIKAIFTAPSRVRIKAIELDKTT